MSKYQKAVVAAVLAFVAATWGEDVAAPLSALLVAAGVYAVPNRA